MDLKDFKIKDYTIDELVLLIEQGEITLDDLYKLKIEDSIIDELKARLEEREKGRKEEEEEDIVQSTFDCCEEKEAPMECCPQDSPKNMPDIIICCPNKRTTKARPMARPRGKETYSPDKIKKKTNFWKKMGELFTWGKRELCNSAVFAPAEIDRGDEMFVQVYIYKDEETNQVIKDSKMCDENTTQRAYTPLNFPIKKGDKITVKLRVYDDIGFNEEYIKRTIWQDKFTKCGFFVKTTNISSKVMGDVIISVNGLELGQMSFFSRIVSHPDKGISSNIVSKLYRSVFISYSHKDDNTVKVITDAYKSLGIVDYFYDRHSLLPGEIFEDRIFEFIDKCDLFVLCWSKNAEKSNWVKIERDRAFELALKKPPHLRMYPINISPYASPPPEMAEIMHFGDYDKLIAS